jgi:hypothetical protein
LNFCFTVKGGRVFAFSTVNGLGNAKKMRSCFWSGDAGAGWSFLSAEPVVVAGAGVLGAVVCVGVLGVVVSAGAPGEVVEGWLGC